MNEGRVYEWNGRYYCSYSTPSGEATLEVPSTDVTRVTQDTAAFISECLDATREQYLAWQQADFTVQCSGETRFAERCQNPIKNGSQVSLAQWIAMAGTRCRWHRENEARAPSQLEPARGTANVELERDSAVDQVVCLDRHLSIASRLTVTYVRLCLVGGLHLPAFDDVASRLGLGKSATTAVRRQLQTTGYFSAESGRDHSGHFSYREVWTV